MGLFKISFLSFFFVLEREGARARAEGRRAEKERESQAGSTLSKAPGHAPWDHDLS